MATKGIEPSPLTTSRTPIPQTTRAKSGALDDNNDPDPAALVKAWPDLPEQTKAEIRALIQTQQKGD
jgi:hypothetical protein